MKTFLLALLLFSSNCGYSNTILQPGDIVIIGFNFKDPDEFSFLTLVDLTPGTVVHFTDCGWKSDNTFRDREGIVTYTVSSSGKKAFEVITYPNDAGFEKQGVGGFFGFSMEGDQILVYQGSFTAPKFIFAVNNYLAGWQSSSEDNNSSALPENLVEGNTALSLNKILNSNYNCIIEVKDKALLLSAIANSSNWSGSNDARIEFPNSCFKNPLPVNLVSFKVNKIDDGNEIVFEVTDEMKVYQYEIQRSEDGINYQTVEWIDEENIQDNIDFYYIDKFILSCYYRLKVLHMDGSFQIYNSFYSKGNTDRNFNFSIHDLNGTLFASGTDSTKYEISSITRNLKNGIYVLKMFNAEELETNKIFIQSVK
jgi:hypothetical protein